MTVLTDCFSLTPVGGFQNELWSGHMKESNNPGGV